MHLLDVKAFGAARRSVTAVNRAGAGYSRTGSFAPSDRKDFCMTTRP